MDRAYVPKEILSTAQPGVNFPLPDSVAHRFTKVLRLKPGTLVELFDGTGLVVVGKLHQLGQHTYLIELEIKQESQNQIPIVIAQAVVKMAKLEEIVQRCTELGATQIVLFYAEFGQVDFKDKAATKIERLERIAQDATRQSGRAQVPDLIGPVDFAELVAIANKFEGFKAYGEPEGARFLSKMLAVSPASDSGSLVIVGPEGGLSAAECRALEAIHIAPAKWGPFVLRTETAALAALCLIQARLGYA